MPPLLRLHYIGKCSRTTCARCGIDTPFDIASNAFYFMRFGEEMREIQGGQVSLPPAPCPLTIPYWEMLAYYLRTVRDRFAPKSPHEYTLFHPIP